MWENKKEDFWLLVKHKQITPEIDEQIRRVYLEKKGAFSPIYYMAKNRVDLIAWIGKAVEKYKHEQEVKAKSKHIQLNNDPEAKYTLRQLRGAWAAGRNSK